MEIDREIISAAILPLLLIQEEQSAVTDESMCPSTGQPLSLPRNSVGRLTDGPQHDFNGLNGP